MSNINDPNASKRNKVFIIAEAGVNHNGQLEQAIKMIKVAKDSGSDAVKFQTGIPEEFVSKNAKKANYQKKFTSPKQTQLEMIKEISLPLEDFKILKKECENLDIEFLSSPFDIKSIDFLSSLGVKKMKIPSGEVTNYPYLRHMGKKNIPIILSSGMADIKELKAAIDTLIESGAKKEDITVLHCNTEYPTPIEDANLNAMITIKDELKINVGYSDHTKGTESAIASAAMGANIIEKHFTLDKSMPGPDQKSSLNPKELKLFVNSIRKIETILGNHEKKPTPSETKNIHIARKSIVACKDIRKGEIFTEDNITTKRPGDGLSPMKWKEILGTESKKDFVEDDLIE